MLLGLEGPVWTYTMKKYTNIVQGVLEVEFKMQGVRKE